MTHSIRGVILAGAAIAVLAVPVGASDPMGAYCIVEKVVLEPGDCPDHAQVWGACAVANPRNGQFEAPARGYFYYAIPTGKEEVVRKEWADLKGVAGKGEAIGFGSRYKPVGRFRPATEKVATPDVYPVNIGVGKLGQYWPAPPTLVQALKDVLKGK